MTKRGTHSKKGDERGVLEIGRVTRSKRARGIKEAESWDDRVNEHLLSSANNTNLDSSDDASIVNNTESDETNPSASGLTNSMPGTVPGVRPSRETS
jgi:hypothetical protein